MRAACAGRVKFRTQPLGAGSRFRTALERGRVLLHAATRPSPAAERCSSPALDQMLRTRPTVGTSSRPVHGAPLRHAVCSAGPRSADGWETVHSQASRSAQSQTESLRSRTRCLWDAPCGAQGLLLTLLTRPVRLASTFCLWSPERRSVVPKEGTAG